MRAWETIAVLIVGTAWASSVAQPGSYREKDWQRVCKQATAASIQEPNLLGPLAPDKLAGCDEEELYYGFHGTPNYAAALQCGWYHRAHRKEADMFHGPGVLTMLYANGQGVARDYDLAIRFACEQGWTSDAEMELRIGHLEAMRDGRAEPAHFDLCDDITSGLSMGACTSIKTSRADVRREQEIETIAARFPESAKPFFARLRNAEAAFEDARCGDEIDLSGTARGMFALEEQKRLRDQFLINLQRFDKGDIQKVSNPELGQLDHALNSVYQDIQRAPADTWKYGTIKPDGIRETERRWGALADAWLDFAKQAYPNLEPNAVRAQIIRLRLHQLRALAPRE
jgi:hypothetical protein